MEINSKSSNVKKPFFSVGITDLVFLTNRSGDLNTDTSTYGRQRMYEGIRLHSKIQRSREDNYQKEVSLSCVIEFDEFVLEIKGRADGINFDKKPPYIEEIKSHACDFKEIADSQKKTHLTQLYFYGYMLLAGMEELDEIKLHLTYIHVDSEKIQTEKKLYKKDEINKICDALIDEFRSKLLYKLNRENERNKFLQKQDFPLVKFRKGQRDLSVAVYTILKRKENLFIEAPTGMGKTIGSLFPALKAVGESILNQIFFLTAKGTGKETAINAMQLMNKGNNYLNSLVITSKSKICFNNDKACDPEECTYTHAYFDKVDKALNEAHKRYRIKGKEEIEEIASEFHICPFELSLDMIMSSDVVICDYNYAYDPRVHLKRIFSEENKDIVILADETHNLVSRAREMYSSEIDENELARAKKVWSNESPALKKAYNRVLKHFKELRKTFFELNTKFLKIPEGPIDLLKALRELMFVIEKFNKQHPKFTRKKELTEDYFYYLETLRIWELYGSGHTTLIRKSAKKINVKLLCLDASEVITDITDRTGGAVFFSGTLTPVDFYIKSLFGERKMYFKRFLSPFPEKNVKVTAATYISTKYKDRTASLDELCKTILSVVNCKEGHYMVFCPSFVYLELICGKLQEFNSKKHELIKQVPEMKTDERLEFLDRFNNKTDKTLIGLVVSAGVFGEGIDLTGDKLIGAIVVGVGLPAINEESDAIAEYYEDKYNRGFEFAYQYPGINTVLQNSGRLIRSETDKGVICFIGKRYARNDYKNFMPEHWDISRLNNRTELENEIMTFWKTI